MGSESGIRAGRAHHGLEAWKLSQKLRADVYKLTKNFPKEKMFGLTAQIRRCAVSIPSNIDESAARSSPQEFAQFLSLARGSEIELDTQLLIAADLGTLRRMIQH